MSVRFRPRPTRGYVLLLMMVSMALIAFVAANFAERIDQLRQVTGSLQQHAKARADAADARSAVLYWLATRAFTARGYGAGQALVMADGRPYRLDNGAVVTLQDQRGLISVNALDRTTLRRLLVGEGLANELVDRWLDVLEDYVDVDALKRLNGAEVGDYAALGLPPPRNDYLVSLGELDTLPAWRDNAPLLQRLKPLLSTRRSNWLNPNTASLPVLRAMFPAASADQLAGFVKTRQVLDIQTSSQFTVVVGMAADADQILFNVGTEVRLTVWAPGLPQAVQYNVVMLAAGPSGPWLITEQHLVPRPEWPIDLYDIALFPFALALEQRPWDVGEGRP